MNQIAKIGPERQSLIANMAGQYHMDPQAFAATVRATCLPREATNEEFAAFLMVAKEYGLNPITREIYAFPKKGGGIQPIVGIDGWSNLINSQPVCDGIEFKDEFDGKNNLVAITCLIHRKDRRHPTMVTEYMAECKRPTEPWQKWPARMLRHKALIQCARYAFGFAGIIDPEEAERSPEVDTGHVMAPPPSAQIAAPPPQTEEQAAGPMVISHDEFLRELAENLAVADSEEVAEEIWDQADVESTLTDDETALQRAFDMKRARIDALPKPFPGDEHPEERAVGDAIY